MAEGFFHELGLKLGFIAPTEKNESAPLVAVVEENSVLPVVTEKKIPVPQWLKEQQDTTDAIFTKYSLEESKKNGAIPTGDEYINVPNQSPVVQAASEGAIPVADKTKVNTGGYAKS